MGKEYVWQIKGREHSRSLEKECFCVTVFCAVDTVALVPDTRRLYMDYA